VQALLREARNVLALQRALAGDWLPAAAPPSPDAMPDLFGTKTDPAQDPSRSPYERVEALIPEDHPVRDLASLEEMFDWMKATVLIPLDETRINPVVGTGDPDADLMIVGEAPGADEDRLGEPFVGRAGQLLNKILEAIEFRREEVYITNILKSRPPNNRDPEPAEVAAHIPVLYKQITLVRPKVILAVGKQAGNALLGRASALGTLRGKFHEFYGLPLMVTYHPAALLRNPQWKRPTWEDMKLLRTRYDELVGRAA
jgi:uracil-DNA glycosylase